MHHDLWDYDLPVAPKLITVKHDGKMVDAVAQGTKFGFLFVFNRLTGEPLWPIEERPVPQSDVPGEWTSPTQPFPTKPPAFARQSFTEKDINPLLTAEEQAKIRDLLKNSRNEGLFTPPSLHGTIRHIQAASWGTIAVDPTRGYLYAPDTTETGVARSSARRQGRVRRNGRRLCSAARSRGQQFRALQLADELPVPDVQYVSQKDRSPRETVGGVNAVTRVENHARRDRETTRAQGSGPSSLRGQPDTILAWYRRLIAQKFDGSRRRSYPGRPRIDPKLEALIIRMAQENSSWGYDRIAGALANLGYNVSDQTAGNVLERHGLASGPSLDGADGPKCDR